MPPRRPRRKFGPSQKDRIFLACLPDAETAARIHALAETLKAQHGLEGALILPEHLHVTLFHLGDWNGLPEAIVGYARAAAEQVRAAPFEVTFTRAESFRNRTGVFPFVLTGDKEAVAWRPLHAALGAALKANGLGGATQGDFKPHITLARDEKRIAPKPVAPVSWMVRDFVLIHSLLGKTTHIHLGRWSLE
ncbi:MAG TPA: 2'-5' RNA ligase family protein [Rhizomicrobium sp.]|nr:2'-5' RNA ligase family protein [Rhizomicrobium sp.]